MNIGSRKKAVACFVAGVAVAVIAYKIGAGYLLASAVRRLPCEFEPSHFVAISGFELKVLSSFKNKDGTRTARLQWRCELKNISTQNIRYVLKIELLDKDRFVLHEDEIDSNHDQKGDLGASQSQIIRDDVYLEYSLAKHLASCRVASKALKTSGQLEAENLSRRRAEKEEQEMLQHAHSQKLDQEAKEQLDAIITVKRKWGHLEKGMNFQQVVELLGKPDSVHSFGNAGDMWDYHYNTGGLRSGHVSFGVKDFGLQIGTNGNAFLTNSPPGLESWDAP